MSQRFPTNPKYLRFLHKGTMKQNKQIVYVLISVVIIIAAWSIIAPMLPKPLEIENITPKELNLTVYQQNNLHFDIKSSVDKTWVNSIVKPKVANTNGKFLHFLQQDQKEIC